MNSYSVNERAAEVVGKREEYLPKNAIIFDYPVELGYMCPVCKTGDLEWSEYRGFIWCSACNKDYPSCLCLPVTEIDKAVDVYLSAVSDAVKRSTEDK